MKLGRAFRPYGLSVATKRRKCLARPRKFSSQHILETYWKYKDRSVHLPKVSRIPQFRGSQVGVPMQETATRGVPHKLCNDDNAVAAVPHQPRTEPLHILGQQNGQQRFITKRSNLDQFTRPQIRQTLSTDGLAGSPPSYTTSLTCGACM
jgi:hypothetical protein